MQVPRRQFLLAGLAASRLPAKPAAPATLFDRGFAQVTRIADGVYATLAQPPRPECASNGGVVVGRDAVLIVEGHMQPAGAALEIEVARTVAKVPVKAAIDTHFHCDHSFGNLAYAEQKIPIVAHEKVARLMKERYSAIQGRDKTSLFAPLERKVVQAADATDKNRKQQDLEKFKWIYAEIDKATITFPTELIPESELPKRIDLGGLTAVVEFRPGHTETDLVIRVPERDIAFTGDVLFNRAYPVSVDADMIVWRKSLEALAGYGKRTQFVPGHGPVCDVQTVREQIELMDSLRAHAEKMIRTGATVDEAERRYVVPKPFQNFRNSAWGWTVGPAMQSYYTKLRPTTSA